jgi:hypothetical protein
MRAWIRAPMPKVRKSRTRLIQKCFVNPTFRPTASGGRIIARMIMMIWLSLISAMV